MLALRRCEPAAAAGLATRLPPLAPCHSGSKALLMRWHHNAAGAKTRSFGSGLRFSRLVRRR
jgi:hypothetical protein